jgi:predicted dehydrogenase
VVSRVAPAKERRIRIVGAKGTAVFDDVRAPDRVLRSGAGVDASEISVPWREPLAAEIDHFLRCVEARARPTTPFEDGLAVVEALARVEEMLAGGAGTAERVSVGPAA